MNLLVLQQNSYMKQFITVQNLTALSCNFENYTCCKAALNPQNHIRRALCVPPSPPELVIQVGMGQSCNGFE